MLSRLIALSLRHPGLVVCAAVLLLAGALWRFPSMAVDVFPDLNAPTVVIMVEAGGLAAEEVEQNAIRPLESAMNGIPGIRRVRSSSALSLGIVWVEFEWGEDIHRARQQVTERMAAVREALPPGVIPSLSPLSSITGEIMLLGLSSPGGEVGPMELRAFAENELRNHLLAVPGVSQVTPIGGALPEIQIRPDPERLALHGLTVRDVVAAAEESHSVRGAGYLPDVDGRELPLRQGSRVRTPDDVARSVIRFEDGIPVTLGQVADVVVDGAPQRGAAAVSGHRAVILSVQKAIGTNTLALTDAVDQALDDFRPRLPKGMVLDRQVFRQADFINASMTNVRHVLRDALILVAVVVILFLMNWRAALITLCALPISLAAAILVLDRWGLGINVMTLGGLAIAIGELVDDAIIDVENVLRRLEEEKNLPEGQRRSFVRIVYEASNEIRSSVVFATLIICLVFLPLLFLGGMEGRFFRPMAIAYIVSIMASLVVALSLTPALCRLLFQGRYRSAGPESGHGDTRFVQWLKSVYTRMLNSAIQRSKPLLVGAGTLTGLALYGASTFGTSFLPAFNEGTLTVFLMMPPGTSLNESDRLARAVESQIIQLEGVRSVARRTGRAERDEHAEPVSSSEIEVTLVPGRDRAAARARLDDVLRGLPGVVTSIGQPIEHRLSHILSGTPAALAINVFGEDLDQLRQVARKIESELQKIPGARDIAAHREVMIDSIPMDYNREKLARRGLTPSDAAAQVEAAFRGIPVGLVAEGIRRTELVVRLAPELRQSPSQLAEFILHTPDGSPVRLREVATIGLEKTSNLITHENGRRKAVISCNVAEGANLGDLVASVRNRVDPIVTEAGCTVTYGGQFEAQQAATRMIVGGSLGVVVLIFAMLALVLHSRRAALLVLINLPLGLIGGVVGVFLLPGSQGPLANIAGLLGWGAYEPPVLTIPALVGFVTLFGIAIRNGILLVNHYAYLQWREGLDLHGAVHRGSRERLVPILMTALSAILGLIPLAMALGQPGGELLAPLAVVVLCGLVSSTFLNLFVLPAAYLLVFRRNPIRPLARDRDDDLSDLLTSPS